MNLLGKAVVLVGIPLVACSGGDKKNNTPDAFVIHDASPDARSCGTLAVTPSTLDITRYSPQLPAIFYSAAATGMVGSATTLEFDIQFWGGVESSLSGTFDLHTGNQGNYKTCGICVLAAEVDSQGQVVHQYFQSGGSVTLTEDPFANRHMIASFTNLQLEEVTLANDATSTPVAGGLCADLGTFSLDHDKVPNAWTCAKTDYDEGTNCNCGCGVDDRDCFLPTTPVMGCTNSGDNCFNAMCVASTGNDVCAANSPTLTVGTPMTGTTIGGRNNYSAGLQSTACIGSSEPGPDVAYQVSLAASTAYTFTLSGLAADYDGGIALLGPGDQTVCSTSPITACVAGADDKFAGQDETFMYTTPATGGGTYYVIVDGYTETDAGTFTLTVTSP